MCPQFTNALPYLQRLMIVIDSLPKIAELDSKTIQTEEAMSMFKYMVNFFPLPTEGTMALGKDVAARLSVFLENLMTVDRRRALEAIMCSELSPSLLGLVPEVQAGSTA